MVTKSEWMKVLNLILHISKILNVGTKASQKKGTSEFTFKMGKNTHFPRESNQILPSVFKYYIKDKNKEPLCELGFTVSNVNSLKHQLTYFIKLTALYHHTFFNWRKS